VKIKKKYTFTGAIMQTESKGLLMIKTSIKVRITGVNLKKK
jgi:hypothetical protein